MKWNTLLRGSPNWLISSDFFIAYYNTFCLLCYISTWIQVLFVFICIIILSDLLIFIGKIYFREKRAMYFKKNVYACLKPYEAIFHYIFSIVEIHFYRSFQSEINILNWMFPIEQLGTFVGIIAFYFLHFLVFPWVKVSLG